MIHWGARTRQMGMFPVNRENIRVFGGGFGPTGRGANMHLETNSSRYTRMPADAWSPCAEHQKKRVPDGLLGALSFRCPCSGRAYGGAASSAPTATLAGSANSFNTTGRDAGRYRNQAVPDMLFVEIGFDLEGGLILGAFS
jgi:hypothetical protein